VGIDRITKEKYGENLDENLSTLLTRIRNRTYIPKPAKERNAQRPTEQADNW